MEARAKRLRRKLSDLNTMAEHPWNKDLAELAEQPLSSPFPLDADEGLKTFVWRFQKDLKELREELDTLYKSLQLDIVACELPSQRTRREVDSMLERTAIQLANYAASLLDSSAKATTS